MRYQVKKTTEREYAARARQKVAWVLCVDLGLFPSLDSALGVAARMMENRDGYVYAVVSA